MKRKHILFIVENNAVPFDRRVWSEATAAREFGYDVSVIAPSDSIAGDRRPVIEGIRIFRHPQLVEGTSKRAMILEYANALFWECLLSFRVYLSHPFHVIHGANPPDHIFLIAMLFRPFGVKYVFDHHDVAPENFVAKYGREGLLFRLLLIMERLNFRAASMVISTNESYKQVALVRGGKREDDVFVVRNGPDLSRLAAPKSNPALRGDGRYLVGYIGVIGQQEGIENLLEAARYISVEMKRTDVRFIVVGKGPHLAELRRLSEDMGLGRIVQFTGFISEDAKNEVLTTADLCVNPEFGNKFTDKSTMVKIMEYMAFGKPIIQFYTKEGEVSAGQSSLYVLENDTVAFARAILSLLDDPERRSAMGAEGRSRIEKRLSWTKQKESLRAAYQHLFH